MVQFVMRAVFTSAQFADFCFQTIFKGCRAVSVHNGIVDHPVIHSFDIAALPVIREIEPFLSGFRFIWDTPATNSILVHLPDFCCLTFMPVGKRFQTTVFHEIRKVMQILKVAGNAIVICDTAQFRIVCAYDFKVRKVQQRLTFLGLILPSRVCRMILFENRNLLSLSSIGIFSSTVLFIKRCVCPSLRSRRELSRRTRTSQPKNRAYFELWVISVFSSESSIFKVSAINSVSLRFIATQSSRLPFTPIKKSSA